MSIELENFDDQNPSIDQNAYNNSSQKEKLEKLVEEMEHKLVQPNQGMDNKERQKAKKLRKTQLALK